MLQGSSEEVEFLVERFNLSLTLLLSILLATSSSSLLLALLVMLGEAHIRIEFGDLVSVLARSRHFNWTCPVEVEVAESKSEMLKVDLSKLGLVHSHVEVGR